MRTLFFKIFVWFWFAVVLLLVTVLALNGLWRARSAESITRPEWTALQAEMALEAYERGGPAELARHAARVERLTGSTIFLLDDEGRALSGRTLPPAIGEDVQRALAVERPIRETDRSLSLAFQPLIGADGKRYVFVRISPHRAYRGRHLLVLPAAEAGWPLLVVAILTAGLVCYGLARYLTAPIRELTRATQRLADGDLGARTGPAVLRRRDEIADLGRHFNHMAERLEAILGAQRELLRNVSHELRSPLARLNVALGLARQIDRGEAAEPLARIEREAERLNDLIGQLLTLSRLEAGDLGLPEQTIALGDLIDAIAEDADFEARGSARTVRVLESCDAKIRGVPELLRSAVENVVRNAIRYTPEGGSVDISVERVERVARFERVERVAVHAPAGTHGRPAAAAGAAVVIRVRDHGPGVPAAELDRLFLPFHRSDQARDRHGGDGAGLGLAIARRAIELHGGEIAARNAPDGGLIVEFTIPIDDTPVGEG